MPPSDHWTKEDVYDAHIHPLMAQVIAICKEHDIPVVAQFQYRDTEEDGPGFVTTTIVPSGFACEKMHRLAAECRPARPVESEMPAELLEVFSREQDRQMKTFAALITRWPNFREHIACGFLGGAVAQADVIGIDVEGWLAGLRRVEPEPEVIVPPEGS